MQLPIRFTKPASILIALFVAGTTMSMAIADEDQTVRASVEQPGLIADLLKMGDVDFALPNGASMDTLLQPTQELSFPLPTAVRDRAIAYQTSLEAATTPQDVLQATLDARELEIERLDPHHTPGPLLNQITTSYELLGLPYDALDILALEASINDLTLGQQRGLAILVEAANRAIVLQSAMTETTHFQAAFLLLDAADAAEALLQPNAATAAACDVFEDPLRLIYLGSPCDDIVGADGLARLVEVDPAGDDTYLSNAGGADTIGLVAAGGVLEWSVTSDRSILEVTGNMSLNFTPVTPIPVPPSNNYTSNFTNSSQVVIDRQVENNTNQVQFLQEYIDSFDIVVEPNSDAARQGVPVALHVDFSGNDQYNSSALNHQGSTADGIGILLDKGGDDAYKCQIQCQGFSVAGIGMLADMGGADTYQAQRNAQGAGDGGFLLDFGPEDDLLEAEDGAQGTKVSTLIPNALPSLLFNEAGDDHYISGDNSQGANNYLVDLAGNDRYEADALSQGVGYAQSEGMLLDAQGDDQYSAAFASQGAGIFGGFGFLLERDGDDHYEVQGSGQGASITTQSFGLLFDEVGSDEYSAGGDAQGFAYGGSLAALIDRKGDDTYSSGDYSQGSASDLIAGGFLGVLVDGDGDDTYLAGDVSQGAGDFLGTGILFDAGGRENYTAGHMSQGSGAGFGVGLLVDGARDAIRAVAGQGDFTPGSDQYTAGNHSQGASGPGGGVGWLMDRHDPKGRPGQFLAENHSQGSATNYGAGILDNANGMDRYQAGQYSQGSSDGAGIAALVDESGKDWYEADAATSQGHGDSNMSAGGVAVGLLLDLAGENDQYEAMANDVCRQQGVIGFAMDTQGIQIPSGCDAAAVAAASATLMAAEAAATQVVATAVEAVTETVDDVLATAEGLVTGGPSPSYNETVYFEDDMENGPANWNTATDGAAGTAWRLVDQTTEPRLTGPNAHSGAAYWYVGTPAAGAYLSNADAKLKSVAIDLSNATQPELRAWIGGSSEPGFDFLHVSVVNLTSGAKTNVASYDGFPLGVPTYDELVVDLSSYVGHSIQLEFRFVSDPLIEQGQGWNVDDVAVKEA